MMVYHHTTLPAATVKGFVYWSDTLETTVTLEADCGRLEGLPAEVDASTGPGDTDRNLDGRTP